MRKILLILALVVWFFGVKDALAEITWEEIGRGNSGVKSVLVDPDNTRLIYFGSASTVAKSEDGGENWRNILVLRGSNSAVQRLLFDPQDKNTLYAATAAGLFRSNNQGRNWARIFHGRNYSEGECSAIGVLPAAIYLGTKGGLFISKDKGRSWRKQSGLLGSADIRDIAYATKEGCVYIAYSQGVYKIDLAATEQKRVFVRPGRNGDGAAEEVPEGEKEESREKINHLGVNQNNGEIYLATSRGVYKSSDRGQSWQGVSEYGLLSRQIKFILVGGDSRLYAVSESGVFLYARERWQELSFNLAAGEIYALSLDSKNNLYAAAQKGLFKGGVKNASSYKGGDSSAVYYQNEPGINEVQQAAVKYAEVEPEKILRWRKQAAKRAMLPRVTLSADQDRDRTINSSVWGTYGNTSGTGKYFIGPDDVTRYKNNSWGISLCWELGDLIWSQDQTSIDVRSRLMVELRNDILDEVTKLYFERLRVRIELDSLALEDFRKKQEKELKVQELTASLDAMTGGYFSRAATK